MNVGSNVYNCRLKILGSHYEVFYEFAKALRDGDRNRAFLELENNKTIFETYSFIEFIRKGQFIV